MNEKMNEKADLFQRLIAYSIDYVFLSIVLGIIVYIGTIGSLFMINNQTVALAIMVLMWALVVIIGFGYFIYYYGTTGQTLGKKMMNIKVVFIDGTPLTYKKGLVRVIGYIIASIPIYFGYIWMLFDENKQNWEDKIAKTYVVKV